jgi:hypothetical protein
VFTRKRGRQVASATTERREASLRMVMMGKRISPASEDAVVDLIRAETDEKMVDRAKIEKRLGIVDGEDLAATTRHDELLFLLQEILTGTNQKPTHSAPIHPILPW